MLKKRINILLLAIVCIGLLFRLYLSSYKFLDWDESVDLYAGKNFLEGKGFRWNVAYERLPVLPILYGLLYEATKNPDFAVSFIFVVFGSLIAIPVYLIAKRLYGEKAGYIGALLTIFIPALNTTILKHSIHPPFLFFLYCGIYASLLAYQENKALYYLLAGVFLTFVSFTRGEGQVYFLVIIVILLATRVFEKTLLKQETIRGLVLMSALFSASFLVLNTSILYKHKDIKLSYYNFTAAHKIVYERSGWDSSQKAQVPTDKLYGTPVENEYSILKAIKRNPRAFLDYFVRSTVLFFTDLPSINVFPFFLFLFVLLAFPLDGKGEKESLFLLATFIPILTYLIIHEEPRYITSMVPVLIIWSARGLCVVEEALTNKHPNPERKIRFFVKVPILFTVLCLLISTLAHARAIDTRGWEAYKAAVKYLNNNHAHRGQSIMAALPGVALYGDLEYKPLPCNYAQLVKQARENDVKYLFLEQRSTKNLRPGLVSLMNTEKCPKELKVLIGEIRGYKFVLYEFSR